MIVTYNIYRRNLDEIPVISLSKLPEIQMKGKKKYTGKKAKIEAVFRLSNELLPNDWSTKQVNDYIGVNLFGTSKWNEYHNLLNQVLDERIAIPERYDFQYKLIVTFHKEMTVGKKSVSTNPMDERVIYLVTKELMGESLEMYKSVVNPIISLQKDYSNEAEND
jgi:hypothetical protein